MFNHDLLDQRKAKADTETFGVEQGLSDLVFDFITNAGAVVCDAKMNLVIGQGRTYSNRHDINGLSAIAY